MESTKKFKAVLTDYKKPFMGEVESPELGEGQLLVKVEAVQINPSDQLFIEGKYGSPGGSTQTQGVGFEGAGTIVDAHESKKDMVGKKVAFQQNIQSGNYQGSWREYIVLDHNEVIVFDGDFEPEKIAAAFINPITVLAIVETAKANGHSTIIHSAACSSLGKMLIKYCKHEGISLINIVRREEQLKTLEGLGAENVFISTEKDFQDLFKSLVTNLHATAFFDAVGGDLLKQVLECMPGESSVYLYGSLGEDEFTFSGANLLFCQKTITNLIGGVWFKSQSEERQKEHMAAITKDLSSGGEIFGSHVVKTFPMSDFEKAIEASLKHASEGKIILKPHDT